MDASPAPAWDLLVGRGDLADTRVVPRDVSRITDGQVLLAVDRVGMTANNVTYGVLGDALSYWRHFPTDDDTWGRVPLWGYADVVASLHDDVAVGTRVYGYLPTSSHLVVTPDRVSPRGFRDASVHRADLPAVYLDLVLAEQGVPAEDEETGALYRPLFGTAFVLDDWLTSDEGVRAERLVFSSASSRTAYCTAALLSARPDGPAVVALTSLGNVPFVDGLGVYERVLAYDELASLSPGRSTTYVDFSGNASLRAEIHAALDDDLVADVVVGVTHHDEMDPSAAGALPGPRPTMFFAPDQMARRVADWGREAFGRRMSQSWQRVVPGLASHVDVTRHAGPGGLEDAWQAVLAGTVPPEVAHVVVLG